MDANTRLLLRENRAHGDDRFPLMVYRMDIGRGESVLDCHWHDEAEFFYVAEGQVLFQADTETFPLRTGEAAFIDGGDIHAAFSPDASPCTYYAIVFEMRLLDGLHYDAVQEMSVAPLRERTLTFPRRIRPGTDWETALLRSVEAILQTYHEGRPGFQTAIKGHLFLMLSRIAEEGRAANRSQASPGGARTERLKKTLLYMQEHYGRPIRIRELAGLIPMSESQFCRFFKAMTRQTPVEYLNAYRIKMAVELLRHTDRKVSDIAMEVGFDHISYFIKVFQRIMRATPAEFRSMQTQGNGMTDRAAMP
ncbi:AraC family transcriptional regulator [Gorillibacterium sp. sgz5001074]|uniref:AraC family transcriptional regulator n=1 Tax=Gorillibacterium sp. sgz5001074 TaxID=3446695 RepID=UPI003F6684F1